MSFLGGSVVKNQPAKQETWVRPLGQADPLEKEMAIPFSILAWEIHRQRSLARYCAWVHKESDMT